MNSPNLHAKHILHKKHHYDEVLLRMVCGTVAIRARAKILFKRLLTYDVFFIETASFHLTMNGCLATLRMVPFTELRDNDWSSACAASLFDELSGLSVKVPYGNHPHIRTFNSQLIDLTLIPDGRDPMVAWRFTQFVHDYLHLDDRSDAMLSKPYVEAARGYSGP